MYSIYVHTTPDGRKYVGSTSQEPNKRFRRGCNYRNSTRFNEAIKLFGWDNIKHEILETVEDKETALKREEYYTMLWRTNEPNFGYNIYICSSPNQDSKNKNSEKMKEFYKNKELSGYASKIISETNRKPVRLKNINTGEIIEFYSQNKCAEFFMTNYVTVSRFINGYFKSSRVFKDYEVLK